MRVVMIKRTSAVAEHVIDSLSIDDDLSPLLPLCLIRAPELNWSRPSNEVGSLGGPFFESPVNLREKLS